MQHAISRRGVLALPLIPGLIPSTNAFGQTGWKPIRSVRIVVPQAPGGTTDIMARLLSAHLQEVWGQSVVVDNKPGAGGAIGTLDVIRSAADGHTILIGNVGSQAIAYTLQKTMDYGADDLIPVSNMISGPNALVINPGIPAKTVPEFVDYLRKNPERTNFGTPGVGQSPHIAGVWFNQLTGTKSSAVHYRGAGAAAADLMSGQIQFMFDALVNAIQPSAAGLLRMLAVTSAERFPSLPDVPTIRETMPELAKMVSASWVGVFLAKGTPAPIVEALNAEMKTVLGKSDVPERFQKMGGVPAYSPVETYGAFVKAETAKWGEVIRANGLQV